MRNPPHASSNDFQTNGEELPDPPPRVACVRIIAFAWSRFRESRGALPPGVMPRWLKTVALGFVLCAGLVWALTWAGMRLEESGRLDWERPALERLEADERFPFHYAHVLETFGGSPMLIPVIVVAAGMAVALGAPLRALSVLLTVLGSKALVTLGWSLWHRARPDFIAEGLAAPGSLHAFPSGHTSQTLLVYGLLTYFWAAESRSRVEQVLAWVLLAALVTLVGVSRLRIGAHWPTDIIAGAAVGAAWLAVLIVALRRSEGGMRKQN